MGFLNRSISPALQRQDNGIASGIPAVVIVSGVREPILRKFG